MVLIGNSKRVVVDTKARRFGNKRHTGTFHLKENIKAKAFGPIKRKRFKPIPAREGGAGLARKVRLV